MTKSGVDGDESHVEVGVVKEGVFDTEGNDLQVCDGRRVDGCGCDAKRHPNQRFVARELDTQRNGNGIGAGIWHNHDVDFEKPIVRPSALGLHRRCAQQEHADDNDHERSHV